MSTNHSSPVTANSFVPWLRELAEKGGKGVVNNIDARCLGRIADELERLHRHAQTPLDPTAKGPDGGRTTVRPTGTGNTPQDVQLTSLVTRSDRDTP